MFLKIAQASHWLIFPDLPMENDIVQQNVFCRKKA
jgi:hypothetical protein